MKQNSAPDERAKRRAGWFARMGLKDALARGGCPLCQALGTSVRRYLFSFLYEGMMSSVAREEFLKGRANIVVAEPADVFAVNAVRTPGFMVDLDVYGLNVLDLKTLPVETASGRVATPAF
ncbi:MAG: hypothetical protein LAO04_20245 [Acidobacteriia bacterium]|nr:hypothetical protein [Terriglobia bacterium]